MNNAVLMMDNFDVRKHFYETISKPWLDRLSSGDRLHFSMYVDPKKAAISLLLDAIEHNHPATSIILDHFEVPANLDLKQRIALLQLLEE